MTALSRREFGRVVTAGVSLVSLGSAWPSAASSLTIGVSTTSFRDLPRVEGTDNVGDVLQALARVRATHVELALGNIEPAPPSTASFVGGTPAYPRRVVFTPEEIANINAAARRTLRDWRARTEPRHFQDIANRFRTAGLSVVACALRYDDSFTDEEIEATFRQAKALGVATIGSPMTMDAARRIAPFAERHGIAVALHNQPDGNHAGAIATDNLASALALSPAFRVKLDIGHLTASNRDALAVLSAHEARTAYVLVRDRLRNGGASQHFGEGDTPIAAVLQRLSHAERPIPAIVEYDYVGLHSSVDEVATSLAYVTRAVR
jgi:sugar phosphate isomerase/epimerase